MTRIGIAIVIHDDGKVLVGVRAADTVLAGKHEFPGGKCEPDEESSDCAVRECREETGLEVVPVKLLDQRKHSYSHGEVELHFWLCRPVDGKAKPAPPFAWVPCWRLAELNFPEANRAVVDLLLSALTVTPISRTDQETLDLDWFAIDSAGHVGHFATAGKGFIPDSILKSKEDLDFVLRFFTKTAPDVALALIIPEMLPVAHSSAVPGALEYSTQSFCSIARKGVFSHDYDHRARVEPTAYYGIAAPSSPLHVDLLPTDLRRLVSRCRVVGNFADSLRVTPKEISESQV